jgi:arabinogalactan endo-1,4-beta-galactosidase
MSFTANTTAYPFPPSTAGIPFSAQGQIAWTRDILAVVQAIPRGLGQGLFYWEPGYVNNTGCVVRVGWAMPMDADDDASRLGSECEDVLLFDADWSQWPARVTAKARASVNMFQGF